MDLWCGPWHVTTTAKEKAIKHARCKNIPSSDLTVNTRAYFYCIYMYIWQLPVPTSLFKRVEMYICFTKEAYSSWRTNQPFHFSPINENKLPFGTMSVSFCTEKLSLQSESIQETDSEQHVNRGAFHLHLYRMHSGIVLTMGLTEDHDHDQAWQVVKWLFSETRHAVSNLFFFWPLLNYFLK